MKLPVIRAIATTFAFFTANMLELLKIIWLPTALFVVVLGAIMPGYMQTMMSTTTLGAGASPEEAAAAFAAVMPVLLLTFLLTIAYYLIIFAGVLKLVIHGEKSKLPFYIGFGGDELRLLGTWALYFLIFVGAYIVVGLVGALVAGAAMAIAGVGPIIAIVVACVVIAAFVWFNLRLSLATPAAVGQRTIGIGPSWNASKGNVFRLLAFWLVWVVIFAVVEIVLIVALMPGYFEGMARVIAATSSGSLEEVEAASQAMSQATMGMYDGSPAAIARLAASTLVGSVLFALWAVASGVAWRLMTEDRPEKHFE